jgi:hypothetical protein
MTKTEELVVGSEGVLPANNVRTESHMPRSEENGKGHINIGGQFSGHYSKCKAKVINAYRANEAGGREEVGLDSMLEGFFEANPGMLVVSITPLSPYEVLVVYTKTMDEEEIEVVQEYGAELLAKVEARRAKAQAEKEAAEAEQEKKDKEMRELAEWARTHKDLFDSTVRELRELKAKLKKDARDAKG